MMVKKWLNVLLFATLFGLIRPAQSEAANSEITIDSYQSIQKTIAEQEAEQKKVLDLLYKLNRKVKKTVTEKEQLQQEKRNIESTIDHLTQKLKSLEETTKRQKARLTERIKVIYRLGDQVVFRTLFSSTNPSELERNLKILKSVTQRDYELIKDYANNLKSLKINKDKLASRLANIEQLQSKVVFQENKLNQEQNLKKKVLQKIKKSKVFSINKMQQLKQSQAYNDSGLLDLLTGRSIFDFKGQLPWPAEGQIKRGFGIIKDQQHKYSLQHKGVFIATKYNQAIHSVFDGVITFVGDINGLGRTLIIDHGDNYYSIYANADKTQVAVGDNVKQNQMVALAGDSYFENQNGIYFEIRHFTEATDPKEWLKGF
jgi:septal ring factor EnvC (AmiA/AmiB activator)